MKNFKLKAKTQAAEREFIHFQRPLLQLLFLFVIFLLIIVTVVSIIELETFLQPVTSVIIATPLLLITLWASRCKKFRFLEYLTMALCLTIYGIYFYNRYQITISSSDLCFGYIFAFFQRMTIERLPMFQQKAIFAVGAASIRSVVVKSIHVQDILFVVLLLVFELILDHSKQKKESELFRLYHNLNEINNNFDELFKASISESVLVLKSNLLECLFFNDAFQENFSLKKESIKEFLQRFRLVKQNLLRARTQVKEIEIKIDGDDDKDKENSRKIEESASITTQKDDIITEKTLFTQLQALSKTKEAMEDSIDYMCCYSASDSDQDMKRLSIKIVPFLWKDQSSFAIIINDITDQYHLTDFKQLNEGKDKTIAAVSHELRTPLNGILGMIQIMEKEITQSHLTKYLKTCKSSAKLLLSLVNSILDMAQSKDNKLKLNPNSYKLTDMLEEVVSLFDFQCQAKGLKFETLIGQDVPKTLFTDKNRLLQILINLIGNALKFTFDGGIYLSVKAEPDNPDSIRFSVTDTGVGIKEQDKDNLFKAFGKLEETANINPNGVGLGLNISNTLAFLLNENDENSGIKVESEFEKGSTFFFVVKKKLSVDETIPTDPAVKTQEAKRKRLRNRTQKVQKKLRVEVRKSRIFNFKEKEEDDDEGFFDQDDELIQVTQHVDKYRTETHSKMSLETPRDPKEFNYNITPRDNNTSNVDLLSTPRQRLLNRTPSLMSQRRNKFTPRQDSEQVLVIDDNAFNLMVAKELIEAQGINAQISPNSKLAIEQIIQKDKEKTPYKLILMDCEMPGMDGYQATEALKAKMKKGEIGDIPVIALTANDIASVKEQCLRAGMLDCLAKPISEEDIRLTLAKYV